MDHIETLARGICIENGRLLLCKPKGGAYAYLPGGHIEFGETARTALVREIEEELGVASVAGRFRGVVENSFLQHGEQHSEISLAYELKLKAPLDNPEAKEDWIEFCWCPLGELDKVNLLPREFLMLKDNPDAFFG